MRRIIASMVGLLFLSSTVIAQEVKKELSASGIKHLHIVVDDADLRITGISGNQVILNGEKPEPLPERAKGLTPLYNNATDNTGMGMEMIKEGDVMKLVKARGSSDKFDIQVPAGLNLKITESSWQGGDFEVSNITGEIEINSKNADIKLEKVSGPITASTTSGDIEVVFTNLNQSKPTFISNISGFIDVTLPESSKANLMLSTMSGEIFSNHDLKSDKNDMTSYSSKIRKEMNGGGVELRLKAISGEIYLRK